MGMKSKRKGYQNENQLRHLFLDAGIHSERCPLSGGCGSEDGRWRGYDLIAHMFSREFKIETKIMARGFQTLYKWLTPSAVDMLIVRADRSEPLVVIPLNTFIELHRDYKIVEYDPASEDEK